MSWVFHHHVVATLMKPHLTLMRILALPKDKHTPQENSGIVYQVPCKDCHYIYTGELEKRYELREMEYKRDVKKLDEKKYTRSRKKDSLMEVHRSAITDNVAKENHTIDWEGMMFTTRDCHRSEGGS